MKPLRKCSWLLVAALTPTPAWAESVTQFAPLEDADSPVPPLGPGPANSSPTTANSLTPAPAPSPSGTSTKPEWSLAATPEPAARPRSVPAPASDSAPVATPAVSTPPHGGLSAAHAHERSLTFGPSSTPPQDIPRSNESDESDDDHYVSISFSVARAVASLYEVTGEVALGRHFGLALLGGLGSLETKHPEYDQNVELNGRELGAQARVYVLGGFDHGLMLGGEALRIWADVSPTEVTDPAIVTINGMRYGGTATLSGEGTLTGLAAFIGYKVIASFGLTLDAKLGWQNLTLTGTGQIAGEAPINGRTVPVSESGAIRENRGVPLFNLNLGWSI